MFYKSLAPSKPFDKFPKNIKDALEIEGYISDVSILTYDAGNICCLKLDLINLCVSLELKDV